MGDVSKALNVAEFLSEELFLLSLAAILGAYCVNPVWEGAGSERSFSFVRTVRFLLTLLPGDNPSRVYWQNTAPFPRRPHPFFLKSGF